MLLFDIVFVLGVLNLVNENVEDKDVVVVVEVFGFDELNIEVCFFGVLVVFEVLDIDKLLWG